MIDVCLQFKYAADDVYYLRQVVLSLNEQKLKRRVPRIRQTKKIVQIALEKHSTVRSFRVLRWY